MFPKHVNKTAGRTGRAKFKQLVLVVSCFRKMQTTQPGGHVVPMSSNLFSLVPVFKTCNQDSREDRLRRGGQVVPMSSNLSSLVLVSETCKQHSREDTLCLCQATCRRWFLFAKHVNSTAGGLVVPMSSNFTLSVLVSETCKQHSREDRLCPFRATCPDWFLFPTHVDSTAGRTGCAYVQQHVVVGSCFRAM